VPHSSPPFCVNDTCDNIVYVYVGVTGNALPEDIAHFVAHGADEVVLKPLTRSKLLDALSRYVQL